MSEIALHLGDCLDVLPTLAAGSVDAVVTDPPYSSGGAFRGDRAQKTVAKYVNTDSAQREFRSEFSGDNRDQRSFLAWCSLWLTACHRASHDGSIIACFSDWRQVPVMTDAIQCGGWVWRNLATWWKPGIRMQRGRFSSSAEFVVVGSFGVPADGEQSPQNVFKCAPVGGEDKEHIAEKPEDVMAWIIGITRPGDTVLDPFMGSGTTGVACVKMGRNFIGIEKDPDSFAIAQRRIEQARAQLALPLFGAAE